MVKHSNNSKELEVKDGLRASDKNETVYIHPNACVISTGSRRRAFAVRILDIGTYCIARNARSWIRNSEGLVKGVGELG